MIFPKEPGNRKKPVLKEDLEVAEPRTIVFDARKHRLAANPSEATGSDCSVAVMATYGGGASRWRESGRFVPRTVGKRD
jgi:hypothetical protein